MFQDVTATRFLWPQDASKYKTGKQLADWVSERTSCVLSWVFMSCTNEIQQVIRLYEARYLFPKLWGALLFMVKTVPEGEGEVGHLLALLTSFLNNLSSAPFIRLCLYVCVCVHANQSSWILIHVLLAKNGECSAATTASFWLQWLTAKWIRLTAIYWPNFGKKKMSESSSAVTLQKTLGGDYHCTHLVRFVESHGENCFNFYFSDI